MSTRKLRYAHLWLAMACLYSIPIFCQNTKQSDTITTKTVEADTLPNFRFFTAKDSVLFTAHQLAVDKPILFFYFSTKCSYCQELTREITHNIDSLKDIQIVFVSGHRRVSIAKYAAQFELDKYPIVVLKDDEKQMHNYFDYAAVPMLRLYDKDRRLIHRQEGKLSVTNLLALYRQKRNL
jgi:peroxiredoxin